MLQFRFDALSDTGRVRDHNEDAGFAGPYLLCVADGVGGAAAGEVAAATASYVVSARALANPGLDPLRVMQAAVTEAHDQLAGGVVADPRRSGMATTLTAILTDGSGSGSPTSATPVPTCSATAAWPSSATTTRWCRRWSTPGG